MELHAIDPDLALPITPAESDDFAQASVSLSEEGVKRMAAEAGSYYYLEQNPHLEADSAGTKTPEDLLQEKLQEKLNPDGVVKFGELGFADVRGANLSGLELMVRSDGPTMRLEDFLLSASIAEIERVMPKMVWQHEESKHSGATIFSANETINNKIRERLASGCSQYDGYHIDESRDLKNYDVARTEVLFVDRWASDVSDVKVEPTLTRYQYRAKVQIQDEYLEANNKELKDLNEEERTAMQRFVNSEYADRGIDVVKQLQESEGFIETDKYIKLRNSVSPELTQGLKSKVERKAANEALDEDSEPLPVVQAADVEDSAAPALSVGISGALEGIDPLIRQQLDAIALSTDDDATAVRSGVEEFLYRADIAEQLCNQRGVNPEVPFAQPTSPGYEEAVAKDVSDVAEGVEMAKTVFESLEEKIRRTEFANKEAYLKLVESIRTRFESLLDLDTNDLRATAEKLREAAKWSEDVAKQIVECEDLNRRYEEILNGREPVGDEVPDLLIKKQESLERIENLIRLGSLDGQEEGSLLIHEDFRGERLMALTELVTKFDTWDEAQLAGAEVGGVVAGGDSESRDLSNSSLSSSIEQRGCTVRVIQDNFEDELARIPESVVLMPENIDKLAIVNNGDMYIYVLKNTSNTWIVGFETEDEAHLLGVEIDDGKLRLPNQSYDLYDRLAEDPTLYEYLRSAKQGPFGHYMVTKL